MRRKFTNSVTCTNRPLSHLVFFFMASASVSQTSNKWINLWSCVNLFNCQLAFSLMSRLCGCQCHFDLHSIIAITSSFITLTLLAQIVLPMQTLIFHLSSCSRLGLQKCFLDPVDDLWLPRMIKCLPEAKPMFLSDIFRPFRGRKWLNHDNSSHKLNPSHSEMNKIEFAVLKSDQSTSNLVQY